MKRLTEEQRKLAAEAVAVMDRRLAWIARRYPVSAGIIQGVFHERVVALTPSFDQSRWTLKTWAHNQLEYAILEARRSDPVGEAFQLCRRIHAGWPRSLDAMSPEKRNRALAVEPRGREAAELADHVMADLKPEVAELYRLYANGYTLREIGEMSGRSESAACTLMARHSRKMIERLAAATRGEG